MALLRLSTLIAILPIIFFINSIIFLFNKEWGQAIFGLILSILLFWLVYLRKKK